MSQNNPRGIGRLFGGSAEPETQNQSASADQQGLVNALQARIAELEAQVTRPTFVDINEDDLNKFVAEDAAVIIRAARERAAKLMEQASQALTNAENDREALKQTADVEARRLVCV